MKKVLLFLFAMQLVATIISAQTPYLITGTYTGGKSKGIYVYRFDEATGTSTLVSETEASNPSYLVVSPDQRFVYAVHENGKDNNGGEVSAYAFDKSNGQLRFLNRQLTGGDHPCYVEVDKTGRWVVTGNYSSGNFSIFPVAADGSLGAAVTKQAHQGSGPNKERQEKPHVHCTIFSPDNKWLYVSDLGIDKVMIYSFDAATGTISAASPAYAATEPGAGPRHITFHPNGRFAYLIEELTGQVVTFSVKKGKLKRIQRISSLPRTQKGFAGSADIHVSADGRFLYATNRGDFNNVVIYQINAATGKLSTIGFHSTLGEGPRNFNFSPSGKWLLMANQNSDEIVVFSRNQKTGLIDDSGKRIAVGKPVCLKWIIAE